MNEYRIKKGKKRLRLTSFFRFNTILMQSKFKKERHEFIMKNKKWTFRLLTLMLSMAFIFSVVGVNTFLTISADGSSTVSIGGLTLTANDGSALVD